jgi:hypothetical protein
VWRRRRLVVDRVSAAAPRDGRYRGHARGTRRIMTALMEIAMNTEGAVADMGRAAALHRASGRRRVERPRQRTDWSYITLGVSHLPLA